MIKIYKKDSIIDVIRKINNCKEKEIVLDFPFGHPIIHNYTSLKILKNKAWVKKLIIITSDKTAQKIGKRLWINYSQIWDSDLLEYNYSFLEYTKYIIKRYFLEISNLFWAKTPDIILDYQKKYNKWSSKMWLFLLGLIISIFLFLFIFYFAVNKTYIYITPEITIKTKAENFVFREEEKDEISNNHIIEINKISKLVYLTSTFWTSWVNEETLKQSKWKVTFYNELNEEIDLLKNTRIQNDDWIIFTSDTNIKIPSASLSESWAIIPWKVDIYVSSKIHDSNWKTAWERANIWDWVLFILPWLKTNQDKIYAKSNWELKWASNDFQKQLTKEDIENAKNILETKLRQQALNEIKKEIQESNEKNNVKYEILWIDDIIEYTDFKVIWEDKLEIWNDQDDFELSWSIKITSYTYNTAKVLNKLSSTVKDWILENIETLLYINDQSLRISNIISKTENPLEIKATAQVEALFSHNFLNKENNYIEKLKSTIAWINKDEALKILLNNKNISDVSIEIRPFFINNISKMADNIIIKVED